MIVKGNEDNMRRLTEENHSLRNCLKDLQKELFEIVEFKKETFMKRYKAERGLSIDYENEEVVRHEIERIRDDIFNLPFEEAGRDIVQRFHQNFRKMKEFMENIDKEMS
jgi:hypothetical protein